MKHGWTSCSTELAATSGFWLNEAIPNAAATYSMWRRTAADPAPTRSASRASAQRHEGVLKHVIRHASAQGDAVRLVERPVDAEVDPALAVLLLGLGQRREAARKQWPHEALVVLCHAVELVRHEGECDAVGPVEPTQGLEEGAAESGMAGRIGWKGRREVGPVEIAGRRAQRHEGRIS